MYPHLRPIHTFSQRAAAASEGTPFGNDGECDKGNKKVRRRERERERERRERDAKAKGKVLEGPHISLSVMMLDE